MSAARSVAVLALLACLLAMTVHYGAAADAHDPYPTTSDLATDYGAHVGDEFFGWMYVVAVENGGLVVADTRHLAVVLRAGPAPPGVAAGDVVQVYGVLEPGKRIDQRRVVVSRQGDRTRMFGVSALAGLGALALFFREWTVDRERLAFVPRSGHEEGESDG